METKPIIPVGGNVEGNITSCKIENEQISVQKNHPFSLFERTTYRSYSVCTGKEVETYTVPSVTLVGFLGCILIGFVLLVNLAAWLDS